MTYVYNIITVGLNPMKTMKGINSYFKFKDNKIEEPDIYLKDELSRLINGDGTECWAMSSDKYCDSAVKNVENL